MSQPFSLCPCCRLLQPPGVNRALGVSAPVCKDCANHQADSDAAHVRRAESHERMVRVRLDACRTSEQEAQRTADQEHEARVSALRSRARLAARIVRAAEAAEAAGCAGLRALADDPDVRKWARRYEEENAPFFE